MINIHDEWIMEIPEIIVASWFLCSFCSFAVVYVSSSANSRLRLCAHARVRGMNAEGEVKKCIICLTTTLWCDESNSVVHANAISSLVLFFAAIIIAICKAKILMPILSMRCDMMWYVCLFVWMWVRLCRWIVCFFFYASNGWHKVSFVIAISYIVLSRIDIGKLSARLRWWSVC